MKMPFKNLIFHFCLSSYLISSLRGSEYPNLSHYVDRETGFSITTPQGYIVGSGNMVNTPDLRFENFDETPLPPAIKLVRFSRRPQKTSGDYAEISVWRSTRSVCTCEKEHDDFYPDLPLQMLIGGQTFFRFSGGNAGMGFSSTIVGYFVNTEDSCWRVQLGIGSNSNDRHLDFNNLQSDLMKSLKSFKFAKQNRNSIHAQQGGAVVAATSGPHH